MINELYILNGSISPFFDPLISTYTIKVDSGVTALSLEYNIDDESSIKIINNQNFEIGENEVYLDVETLGEVARYTLLVQKEEVITTFNEEVGVPLEITPNTVLVPDYTIALVLFACLFMIGTLFKILFLKKKKRG